VGFDVFYLQNITDIDDKIINRAHETNTDWKALSEKFEKLYVEDMEKLNNLSVSKFNIWFKTLTPILSPSLIINS
jgi:cysteinyl-tRNA synthetase